MKRVWVGCLPVLFFLFWPLSAKAVTPISQYTDLVAGSGEAGYKDGSFTSAMFDSPHGAVFSKDKTKIFLADTHNHCIRMVDLDRKNAVSTLTGTGQKGAVDGSFETATFDSPALIVSLPGNQLMVYDIGNNRFRLLDLSQKQVTTLLSDDAKQNLSLATIASIVVDSQTHSIYFSQPDSQSVKRMDLLTRKVTTVFSNDPRVLRPAALCLFKGKLCVAGQGPSTVYQVDSMDPVLIVPPTATPIPTMVNTPSASPTGVVVEPVANTSSGYYSVPMTKIAEGEGIQGMTESDGILYAFQNTDVPWVRLTAGPGMPAGEVKFMSVWGPFLESKSEELQNILDFRRVGYTPGFIPFPDEPRKFLFVSENLNQVFAIRDYAFYEYKSSQYDSYAENPNGLTDFSYSETKPPHTFRILMLGDSRVFYEREGQQNQRWPWGFHRQETTPKKLEADLNFEASLDDVSTHFQVLTYARYGWAGSLQVWPYFWGVSPVQKFDVDAVVLLMPNVLGLSPWFTKPYLKEGIPNIGIDDNEYMLKPMEEKLANQPLEKDFYERCLKHNWVSKDHWDFADIEKLSTDSKVWSDLVEIVGKPMSLYQDELKSLEKKVGHPIHLYVFFVPVGSSGAPVPVDAYRKLYKEAYSKVGIDLEDLTDPWTALKISGYPVGEFWGEFHFDYNGHTLLSFLMAHTLIQNHLIPFDPDK